MATKFITNAVESINKNNAGEVLRRMGEHCIKQAYANNSEDTQYALDNLVQWARKPFVNWLRSVGGLSIENPATGSARYTVEGVKDQKRQAKAIAAAKETPVLHVEHTVKAEKVVKPLEGLTGDRVAKVMEKLIAKLKNTDPDAAAFINDVWATKLEASISTEFAKLKIAA